MERNLLILLLGIFLCMTKIARGYMMDGYGNNMHSVKTSYFWTHPKKSIHRDDLSIITHNGRTCKAIQLNVIARHGARYVYSYGMDHFTDLQNKIKNSYRNSNFSFISYWVNDYPRTKAGSMVDLGIKEMEYLGMKYTKSLQSIFSGRQTAIKMRSSHITRTITSSKAFLGGMTNELPHVSPIQATPQVDNNVTLFYEDCTNYNSKVAKNKTFMHEMYDFQKSATFQKMISGIVKRLGMNQTLSVDDVKIMYRLCATEVGIMNRTEWCTLQTNSDREILEYEGDLQNYYNRMYGHPIIAQMACPAVSDIFRSMDNAIRRHTMHERYPVADIRIGHSATIGPLLAALGLFEDSQPLTAQNFDSMKNRKFFDSTVIPFGGHLAFILYDCGGGRPLNGQLLKLLVNEQPTIIPACGSDTCDYAYVRKQYEHMIDQCHWNRVCKGTNVDPSQVVG